VRDELGLDSRALADPMQAAMVSAGAFASGAALPVLAGLTKMPWVIVVVALVALVLLGIAGARVGGADSRLGAARVLVGGGAAMAVTAGIGAIIGAVI
jgi:VIT1/CCC1 family predicted Fe2+/Mn2+ transporter